MLTLTLMLMRMLARAVSVRRMLRRMRAIFVWPLFSPCL